MFYWKSLSLHRIMGQINFSIKNIFTLTVILCLLVSVISFISIPIIQKIEFEKSSLFLKKQLDTDINACEEKENEESNEAYDYFTQPDYVRVALTVSFKKTDFLYKIAGKIHKYRDTHFPPPKC